MDLLVCRKCVLVSPRDRSRADRINRVNGIGDSQCFQVRPADVASPIRGHATKTARPQIRLGLSRAKPRQVATEGDRSAHLD